ncbi:MAG: hypothetical protein OEY52_07175 [Gammaproteobacteria bacterium]|nr:hypothetical protein [Gammaproteobacteria bacterium]
MMKYISLLILLISFNQAFACSAPKSGFDLDKDQLIEKSKTIVLAKLKSMEKENSEIKYTLVPLKILKGNKSEIVFRSISKKHYDNDFNFHKDGEFWMNKVGRSEFPCCICGPDHTFRENELYLLFPDSFGAMKSGEIIKDINKDEWYKYVLKRIK